MEPMSLTCPNCNTSWKLIKAGEGPITCPNCKAVVDTSAPAPTIPEVIPAPPASTEAAATPPIAAPTEPVLAPAPQPIAPMVALPKRAVAPAPEVRPTQQEVSDLDDPSFGADYDDRFEQRPRRRMHPLILVMLLVFLLPLAGCVLFGVVCAAMIYLG